MLKTKLTVLEGRGLHAGVAAHIVKLALSYESELFFEYNEETIDVRSVIGLLTMGAGEGSHITLTANGSDEKEASEAIEEYFKNGFPMTNGEF